MNEARRKRAALPRKFEIDFPEVLSRVDYDRRLSQGWFRTGSFLARVSLLCLAGTLKDTLDIRIPLARYSPTKSRRRLLRRNRARFRRELGPARVDEARSELYQKMKPRFVGPTSQELDTIVFGPGPRLVETRECAIYLEDQLVAVSYFDVGRTAVASILGLYDREFSRSALGIYTLLEELEVAQEVGARYFYPGSIVAGLPGFDYKLSFGPVQFLGTDGRWRARARTPHGSPRAEALIRRLQAVANALEAEGHSTVLRLYPGYPLGYVEELGEAYLQSPAHIEASTAERVFIVESAPANDSYLLVSAEPAPEVDLLEGCDPLEAPPNTEMRALRYERLIARSPSEHEIARSLRAELEQTRE